LQITPTPVDDNKLRINISAEEAKPQEFGLSIGYGSFDGGIIGINIATAISLATGVQ
jgi:hypothetical protein